jgi:hypothetical protein
MRRLLPAATTTAETFSSPRLPGRFRTWTGSCSVVSFFRLMPPLLLTKLRE